MNIDTTKTTGVETPYPAPNGNLRPGPCPFCSGCPCGATKNALAEAERLTGERDEALRWKALAQDEAVRAYAERDALRAQLEGMGREDHA